MRSYRLFPLPDALVFALMAICFLATVFTSLPFLHPESIVISHWWNEPGFSFLNVLFDPVKTDQHVGRFRYLTYLAEGTYWRLFANRLLPQDFYDYLAITINLALAYGIQLFGKKLGLRPLARWALASFFLFSCQAFLTSTWHCRKAKYLVSAELLGLALLSFQPRKNIHLGETVLGALAIITDPYAILLMPLLASGLDFYHRRKFSTVSSLLLGYAIAFVAVCLLNGVIGPWFNSQTRLVFWGFQHIPSNYFNWKSTFLTPLVLTDLVAPYSLQAYPNRNLLLLPVFLGLFGFLCWKTKRAHPLGIAFFVAMPVAAFIFEPKLQTARFATYYGHPVLLLFVLALTESTATLSRLSTKVPLALGFCALALSLFFHQRAKEPVFLGWSRGSLVSNLKGMQAYAEDEALLQSLQAHFRNSPNAPITIELDGIRSFRTEYGYVFPKAKSLDFPHHELAYLTIPLLFREAIATGKLHIEDNVKLANVEN